MIFCGDRDDSVEKISVLGLIQSVFHPFYGNTLQKNRQECNDIKILYFCHKNYKNQIIVVLKSLML